MGRHKLYCMSNLKFIAQMSKYKNGGVVLTEKHIQGDLLMETQLIIDCKNLRTGWNIMVILKHYHYLSFSVFQDLCFITFSNIRFGHLESDFVQTLTPVIDSIFTETKLQLCEDRGYSVP